jgi:hypothetical protein
MVAPCTDGRCNACGNTAVPPEAETVRSGFLRSPTRRGLRRERMGNSDAAAADAARRASALAERSLVRLIPPAPRGSAAARAREDGSVPRRGRASGGGRDRAVAATAVRRGDLAPAPAPAADALEGGMVARDDGRPRGARAHLPA